MTITEANLKNLKTKLNLFKIGYSNFICKYHKNNNEMNKNILKIILTNIEHIQNNYLQKAINFLSDCKNKIELLKEINLEWDNKIGEINTSTDEIWLENNQEKRKKMFSELKVIKHKFELEKSSNSLLYAELYL